jgi:hypothetical protein
MRRTSDEFDGSANWQTGELAHAGAVLSRQTIGAHGEGQHHGEHRLMDKA